MSTPRISLDEVRHIAKLSRLAFTPEELERLRGELDRILEYVTALQAVDVEGVPPTMHVHEVVAPMREDVVEGQLPRELALREAPLVENDAFAVPKVMEIPR